MTNQQSPSELDRYEQYKNNPYYPFESEKQWLEYDNQLIDKVREKDKSPSAIKGNIGNNLIEYLNSEKFDGQAPSDNCTEDKHIKGCKCGSPSATVDDVYDFIVSTCYQRPDVNLRVDLKMRLKALANSQQEKSVVTQNDVDVDALWDKHSIERNEMNYEGFKRAISELSQKRYTAQQMKDFAFEYHIGTYIRDVDKALSQFDSEGK